MPDDQLVTDTQSVKRMIIAAVEKYDHQLEATGAKPQRHPTDAVVPNDHEAYAHLRWMCQRVKELAEEGRFDKAHRWLGFIQGVLWRCGAGTITEYRKDNTREQHG